MIKLHTLPLPSPIVRHWLYRVTAAGLLVMVAYGIIDPSKLPLWLELAGAILGTVGASTASVALKQQRRDGTI